MSLPHGVQNIQEVPVNVVGGNHFGRYPKISVEQTFNMIISDNTLVDYAGYKNILTIADGAKGRGAYASSVKNIILCVVGSSAYVINDEVNAVELVGNLFTSSGQVYIAENNGGQIAVTDGVKLYVYDYGVTPATWKTSGIDFNFPSSSPSPAIAYYNPGFISFQNGRFIVCLNNTSTWVLSDYNSANASTSWPADSSHIGSLQTKPDFVQAVLPFPGRGNTIFVMGRNVIESWIDVGAAKFPYQKATSYNIDYGTINPNSIAHLENFIVWLSVNEQSGLSLMVSDGGSIRTISTDGIDFKLGNLSDPQDCSGFLFRQDGHLLYQFTFISDNLSYTYDFETHEFFTVTDENLNFHPARDVIFFNNKYYFVSINDGNLYEFGTQYSYLQYAPDNIEQMPRIRITSPIRHPNNRYFVAKSLQFLVENGQPNDIQIFTTIQGGPTTSIDTESQIILATEGGTEISTESVIPLQTTVTQVASEQIRLAKSINGGESFGSYIHNDMNPVGHRKSLMNFQKLGMQNDLTFKIKFDGYGRFVAQNGTLEIYQ